MELGGDPGRRHAEPTEERGRGLEQREGHPLARVAFWHRERESRKAGIQYLQASHTGQERRPRLLALARHSSCRWWALPRYHS